PGESLIVSFKATRLDIWFDTEAKVVRNVRGRRHGDKGRGVGLRFLSLDPVKRLILRGHLRRVPPPVPRRTQRIDWSASVRSIAP
ncbi:MAG TPA: PilZ domain-containing protein, partial [Labilithrix sp.]